MTPAIDHAEHDPLLIAAHLDSTLDARETTLVDGWLATCASCADLRSDLAALAAATRSMATPPRPRDFTLSQADADRARARGWRRILATVGSSRDTVTRPLALGLTTLGLAGLVLANLPSASFIGGSGAASSQIEMSSSESGAAAGQAPAAAGPSTANGYVDLAPSAEPQRDTTSDGAAAATADPQIQKQAQGDQSLDATTTGPSFLIVGSVLLLLTGLALALLRWGARRLGDG